LKIIGEIPEARRWTKPRRTRHGRFRRFPVKIQNWRKRLRLSQKAEFQESHSEIPCIRSGFENLATV
jgi:hypothetical protein